MSGADSNVKTPSRRKGRPILRVAATLAMVAVAAVLGWRAWALYMGAPWTRDGTVRAYVVQIAPQVAGEIVQLPVADNQFVRKGDLLMLIDPRDYAIAVRQAKAAVDKAKADADNARAEAARRQKLDSDAVTVEELQTYEAQAASAEASYQAALANLDQARVNLKRTQVRSPVNGYVTNLVAQVGNYATAGTRQISIVNTDSFWVDAYFEETALHRIRDGDQATIKLMGYQPLLTGRVSGTARGVNVANAEADATGLATVNPIFTFVRLAQRVPVRIHLEDVPKGVQLVMGLTATVQVDPGTAANAPPSAPSAPVSAAPSPETARADGGAAASSPAPVATPPAPAPAAPSGSGAALPAPAATASAPSPASVVAPPPGAAAPSSPAGDAASVATARARVAADAEALTPSEYLGKTIDLYGSGATPVEARHAPEPLRHRSYGHRYRREE